ncbi:uncharacterized protein LOC124362033 isoform X2 [Homalodisca vitripennis]|nr:uncharacterized protein LOC124362033 isoform X2 [Homalodisca vitripennis]
MLPALVRLGRLGLSRKYSLNNVINRESHKLIQSTWKLIREKSENILEEASVIDRALVIEKIRRSFPGVNVSKVLRVNNPYLTSLYELVKAEYHSRNGTAVVQELELFHSTRQSAVESIVEDNLNWRLVRRSRYGIGNSFSTNADYANCHSNRHNGDDRALILFKVLVCKKARGSGSLKVLKDADTAVGGPNNIVTVKFNDNEFLPTFIAYYKGEKIHLDKLFLQSLLTLVYSASFINYKTINLQLVHFCFTIQFFNLINNPGVTIFLVYALFYGNSKRNVLIIINIYTMSTDEF